jgi:hypothetical protein
LRQIISYNNLIIFYLFSYGPFGIDFIQHKFLYYYSYIMSGFAIDIFPSKLGGGIPGGQPPGGLLGGGGGTDGGSGMDGGQTRGMDRKWLRKAFNPSGQVAGINGTRFTFPAEFVSLTPFRRAFNAGDIRNTKNSAPLAQFPGANQVNGRTNSRLNTWSGGVHNNGAAFYSGNPKHVYDSSDYIRFRKLQAKNRNYNDSSFGGANNGSFVAWNRVKH